MPVLQGFLPCYGLSLCSKSGQKSTKNQQANENAACFGLLNVCFIVCLIAHCSTTSTSMGYHTMQQDTEKYKGQKWYYIRISDSTTARKIVPKAFCGKIIKVDVTKNPAQRQGFRFGLGSINPYWRLLQTGFRRTLLRFRGLAV